MNENQAGQKNLLDTTDCLEAIGVFRGWKNFLFVILILCLLLLQISFWLVDTGWVPAKRGPCIGTSDEPDAAGGVPGANVQDVGEAAKKVAAKANQPAEATSAEPQQSAAEKSLFGIQFGHLAWLIRFANVVLILAATLYCLTMLFSLKISLIGRLGGINHICRAFFLSLIMLVLLLPWQRAFGRVVIGAMYTPHELTECSAETGDILYSILYYLRFTGYWLLIVLLLIFSYVRSCRWTKGILRRLEVI
jgi:hypothetical protein